MAQSFVMGWFLGRGEKGDLEGSTHVWRQISFKIEMEDEDLKTETLDTLYALGNLGALQ